MGQLVSFNKNDADLNRVLGEIDAMLNVVANNIIIRWNRQQKMRQAVPAMLIRMHSGQTEKQPRQNGTQPDVKATEKRMFDVLKHENGSLKQEIEDLRRRSSATLGTLKR